MTPANLHRHHAAPASGKGGNSLDIGATRWRGEGGDSEVKRAMALGSLFSGIGLLDLGLERAGLSRVSWQVEIDPFCRRVLTRHWPDAVRYEDVRSVSAADVAPVDVLCGGFPCQPVSVAGKRKAQSDARWLWPDFARLIGELTPSIVIAENVPGLRTAGLRDVLADLARLGFDAEWTTLSAAEVGAPHGRERLWLAATHPDRVQLRDEPGWLSRACGEAASITRAAVEGLPPADADGVRRLQQARQFADVGGWTEHCGWAFDPAEGVDDGSAPRMVGARRKALGNGVVVRCAEVIGRAVMDAIELRQAA